MPPAMARPDRIAAVAMNFMGGDPFGNGLVRA
jgi:hypothetical protein